MNFEENMLYRAMAAAALKAATELDRALNDRDNAASRSVSEFAELFDQTPKVGEGRSPVEFDVLLSVFGAMEEIGGLETVDDAEREFRVLSRRVREDVTFGDRSALQSLKSSLLRAHAFCLARSATA